MKIAVSLQNQKINYISSFPGGSHVIKSCGQGVSCSPGENTDVKFYWEKYKQNDVCEFMPIFS